MAWPQLTLDPTVPPASGEPGTGGPAGARATARGRATEAAFLAAGREVIARDGFVQARIVDIAEASGRSLGSFYNYFQSKEDLLEVLADEFRRDVNDRIAAIELADRDTYDVMSDLVRAYWDTYKEHANVLSGVFQASLVNPRFAAYWRGLRADGRAQIAASIIWFQSQGCCPGIDPAATASALGSMLDYFCHVWLVEGGEQHASTIDDDLAVTTLAHIWFHSVAWRADDGAMRPTTTAKATAKANAKATPTSAPSAKTTRTARTRART